MNYNVPDEKLGFFWLAIPLVYAGVNAVYKGYAASKEHSNAEAYQKKTAAESAKVEALTKTAQEENIRAAAAVAGLTDTQEKKKQDMIKIGIAGSLGIIALVFALK
jgi:predicted exporter